MANRFKKFLKSFTLIELIIVIAIIAVLGVSAFLLLSQWISKGRDSRKISDIQTIQKSLEIRAMESGIYPMPDGEVIEGKLDGAKLSYLGEIGSGVIEKLGNFTKIPQDPKTKSGYKYGVTYDGKEYEIGTVLESAKKQALVVGSVLADDLEQKVIGKYDGYITYENNNKYYIANIPSLLYNYDGITTNGVDLDGNQIYYTVDGGENLLYDLEGNPVNKLSGKKIVEEKYSLVDYGVKALEITGSVSDLTPEQITILGGEEKAAAIFKEKVISTDIASLEKVDGKCGTANGGSFATSIEGGLCEKGIATAVILSGTKFQWSCEGQNEGATASCEANKFTIAAYEDGYPKLSISNNFSCAIDINNDLRCWGDNGNGILLDGKGGGGKFSTVPVKISQVSNIKTIGTGIGFLCVLDNAGDVYCRGTNSLGQIGNGTVNFGANPYKTISDVKNISISKQNACALKNSGEIYCWGSNNYNFIDNTTNNILTPTNLGVSDAKYVVVSTVGVCYINQLDKLYCRGFNSILNRGLSNSPSFQHQMDNVKKVVIGHVTATVLTNNGNVYVWGRNDGKGELGNNSYTLSVNSGYYTIFDSGDIENLYANHYNVCAKKSNQDIWCWGDNFYNQITSSDIKSKIVPIKTDHIGPIDDFSISQTHSCISNNDGVYKCIGSNNAGQLGNGSANTNDLKVFATNMDHLSDLEKSTLYDNHTFGIDASGNIWGWLNNNYGQLGNGNFENQNRLVKVNTPDGVKFNSIYLYNPTKCGLSDSNELYCWGGNMASQLGLPGGVPSTQPVLMNINNIKQVSSTYYGPIVLKQDGTVESIGWRPLLGNGSLINVNSFTGVINNDDGSKLSNIKKIDSRYMHACALTNDGQVYCWGDNVNYSVGTQTGIIPGNPRYINKAVKVGISNVRDIFIGLYHSCAIKDNDELWCWGHNNGGQLGNGSTNTTYIPQKVVGLEGKKLMKGTSYRNHSCVITGDKEVYCWGHNGAGQIGDGTQNHRNQPVRVQGLSNVVDIMLGDTYSCGKKESGSIFCRGTLRKFGQIDG